MTALARLSVRLSGLLTLKLEQGARNINSFPLRFTRIRGYPASGSQ